jgi:NOL1/NOP2/fmu family ribosome biogenesis protein
VPIFKWNNNKELRPVHGLGNCLWHLASKNTISLSDSMYQTYSEWFDIPIPEAYSGMTGYVIIQFENYWFSVGKIVDGQIKNKFIK